MVSVLRAPDGAPLKSKMIYASSKDAIKKKFTGESSCDPLGSEVTGGQSPSGAQVEPRCQFKTQNINVARQQPLAV